MKMRYRIPINVMRTMLLLATVSTLLALCACVGDTGRLPEDVKRVVEAVKSNEPQKFAAICSYPVERPYPLRDVADAHEMEEYYKVLVDDSLRRAITKAPAAAWSELGWRGWTLDDGKYLWIDSTVYNISYISSAEKELIRTLSEEEIKSLPKDLRAGWHPATCLRDMQEGTVYRIDVNDNPTAPADSLYRLCIYPPEYKLEENPKAVLTGELKMEGSAGVRTFYFRNGNGDSLEYSPDDTDDEEAPNIIWKPTDGTPVSCRVQKAYWRDLIHPENTEKLLVR